MAEVIILRLQRLSKLLFKIVVKTQTSLASQRDPFCPLVDRERLPKALNAGWRLHWVFGYWFLAKTNYTVSRSNQFLFQNRIVQYGQFRAPCPLCCGTSLETLSSWLFSLQCFFPHQCLLPSHLLNPQTEAKKKERTHMSPVCSPLNYFLWQSISQITFSSLL